jgi:hypothetical protein
MPTALPIRLLHIAGKAERAAPGEDRGSVAL